jgi:hypothetical protein
MVFITANQCVVLISALMQTAVCPAWCLGTTSVAGLRKRIIGLLTIGATMRDATVGPVERSP